MTTGVRQEQFMEQKVTYVLLKDGKLYVIENVPARVNQETGEQFFSPQTVEHFQHIIGAQRNPTRFVQTPIYEYR
jgi:YgiT-type zinc finger domain-containing protein